MKHSPFPALWLLGFIAASPGCLSLSIGGRTVTVTPDVEARVSALESRVDALEHQTYGAPASESQSPALPVLPRP
jgi:hypothetical protein